MSNEAVTNEAPAGAGRDARQAVIGTVMSDKMDKTIVVVRDRKVLHPLYKKYVRRRTRFVAHDEANVARKGDEVEIVETRPLSKTKRWRLVRVVREAPRGELVSGTEDVDLAGSEEAQS